jgi:hypothetical protein
MILFFFFGHLIFVNISDLTRAGNNIPDYILLEISVTITRTNIYGVTFLFGQLMTTSYDEL